MASKKEKSNELIAVLKQIAQGKEEAIRLFYLEHYNQFINYGRTITQDRHAVEDAIQLLLIWIVENPRKARRLDRPDVYFYRSLRNNLIKEQMASREDLQEKLRERLSEMMITQSAEKKWVQNEEEQEILTKLQGEIGNLPDYLQQTLYLRYFSDMAYDDIGEILHIKPNVARIYIHRAIERLRTSLKDVKIWWGMALMMFQSLNP